MNDFKLQYLSIREEIDSAIQDVLDSGWYILGDKVTAFEQEFAQYCKSDFAVGVGNGLDALKLTLRAFGIKNGDEVITVSNTAVATALAISLVGAKPVFVDIDPTTYTLDITQLESKINNKTKAIIPVHLFGHPVDMEPLMELANKYKLVVIEDACQAHGSEYRGRKVGSIGNAGCFSFYPTKNLGAYGDGGMILTNNKKIAEKIMLLRNYGQESRYVHIFKGENSRLDELQAAILSVKLKYLDKWNEKRRYNAEIYKKLLKEVPEVICPIEKINAKHIYHLYVIRTLKRNDLQNFLKSKNIITLIHYPIPIHLQKAYKNSEIYKKSLPVTERVAEEILSLPMYPELQSEQIKNVAESIKLFYRG